MYKIVKEEGGNNIFLQNTDALAEINLGKSYKIGEILKKHDYFPKDEIISYYEKWNISIDEETKDELLKIALPMKKPIRKKVNSNPNDLLDIKSLLYGID